MSDRRAIQRLLLGTAVKITSLINIDATISSATITIIDPMDTKVVNGQSMILESAGVYAYTWQSLYNGVEGDYVVTIYMTEGAYTSVKQDFFTLVLAYPGNLNPPFYP